MKKYLIPLFIALSIMLSARLRAQSQELQQLLLNIEKLNQLRAVLNEMYKGYTILTDGYNTVKSLSEGNFNLHKIFLDGLLEVSPVVRQYKRIADIIADQKQLSQQIHSALQNFSHANIFSERQLDYFNQVYQNLTDRAVKNLDELLMVVTSGQLRMNDAERLSAIDRIHRDMQDKLQFLHYFNDQATLVGLSKQKELQETDNLLHIYGLKN